MKIVKNNDPQEEIPIPEELQIMLRGYKTRVHAEANLLDPAYRLALAAKKTDAILGEEKKEFHNLYYELVQGSTSYPELPALIERVAPEVLEWLEARRQLILAAEQISVKPLTRSKSVPTEEAIRSHKIRVLACAARDKAAQRTAVLDAARELETTLKDKYEMDDDEVQQHVRDYVDDLLNDLLGDGSSGKKLD
jgi:hypothetical protein